MDNPGDGWTRREFLRGAAGIVAVHQLPKAMGTTRFAYVGCGDDSLRVFRVQGEFWRQIQRVPSRAPAYLLLSASQQTLYVVNDVDEHEGQARGTVEALHIHPEDGRLTLLSRTALSLSATRPRHMAVSPDGELLAVAAYGGGIYNLVAIAQDGSLGRISSIFKDAGCGAHLQLQASAHPHTLLFDAGGRLLSSDFGSDRLSVFALEDGGLRRRMQRSTGEGSGPSHCVFHPSGSFVYTWHGLEGALVCYRYGSGGLGEEIQRVPLSVGGLAVHPSGRMLYTAEGAWRIDATRGRLSRGQRLLAASQTVVSHDGTMIYFLDGVTGSIDQATADPRTGEVHFRTNAAVLVKPSSMALKTV
ncbi:MAG TPA: beta-propeller fold lactonase family protein [Acidobacteriaceae bacterium]|nr:beta-propeller fold lactonase family protein [Acidobacteriaceae bacterium]